MLTYADVCKYLSSNNVLLGRNLSSKVPILRTYETHALKEAIDAIVHKNLCSSNVLLVVAYPRM
jgi:hypothetical protein